MLSPSRFSSHAFGIQCWSEPARRGWSRRASRAVAQLRARTRSTFGRKMRQGEMDHRENARYHRLTTSVDCRSQPT